MINELNAKVETLNVAAIPNRLQPGINMKTLIGKPHIFSKYCETREGFMIIPIGIMTLQEDGRVTGYHHPNEAYWRPYKFGTVDADKSFAFVHKENKFIPSSTWQQTFQNMPVGFFCGEPELPQKMCLVPHTSRTTQSKIIYLIASCLRFYNKTVPKLLQELFAEGIEPCRIKVVVNGCNKSEDEIIDGVSFAFTTHNAWELTALYEAPLNWQFDYAMLIHDTNSIFPGFKRRVESFNNHLEWDHLPATPLARCLMGLYSFKFLMQNNTWLGEIDGISKNDGIIAEVAGELLQRSKAVLVMGDIEHNGAARSAENKEVADFFNQGTMRIRRVFSSINLHKFTHINLHEPNRL